MIKKAVEKYIKRLQKFNLLEKHNLNNDVLKAQIDCVSYDSRKLSGKSLFICKGANFKQEYLEQSMSNGAIAYIAEKPIGKFQNYILVKNIRSAIKILAPLYFDYPANDIQTIGITGTKGKSIVAYIVRNILDKYLDSHNKKSCAFISSIETYDGKELTESSLTTPEAIELHQHFYNAKNNDIEFMVMEVSSQALKYERIFEIPLKVACWTNFGKDHISDVEHSSLQDYFESKLKIFDNANVACINSHSDRFDEIFAYAKDKSDVITYGNSENDTIICSDVKTEDEFSNFHVKSDKFSEDIKLPIPGMFNIENALAAIAISYSLDVPVEFIKEGIESSSAPGRMKIVVSKKSNIRVIVDYAHNEMSYEALFKSIELQYSGSKVITIFGCPGNKAQNRRKDLPEIASKYSNYIIICEEDSGKEPFDSIANDIVSNIQIENYEVIEDRDEALRHAIFDLADDKTVIVFAGKGEETYLKRGDVYQPCENDLSIAKKYIKKLDE